MRVLVTRPEPSCGQTAVRLEQLGHQAVRMPLFETQITASPEDLPPAHTLGAIIATSARAFAMFGAGAPWSQDLWQVPVHAVGPGTAAAAQRAGFADVGQGAGTAADLAAMIAAEGRAATGHQPGEGPVPEKILVYLAGVPRKSAIEDALAATKRSFLVVESYQMHEISYSTDIKIADILSPTPDAVLLYSVNAVRRLAALIRVGQLDQLFDSTRFICLSRTIAAELPETWRERAVAARHPDEDSLLASLAGLG